MKQLHLILIGIFASITIFGQEYFLLIQENREWNVLQVGYNWNFTDTIYHTKSYKIEGDTVIGSHNYLKVYYTSEEFPLNWNYEGCIREDQDKKVYFIKKQFEDEWLKYDFGAEIGDTIEIYNSIYPTTVILNSIDSIYINGFFRKKYNIRGPYSYEEAESWIEGIGSNRGILQSGTAGYVGGWTWFICMADGGELIYMDPNYNSCFLISTGVEEISLSESEIEIYPNPATDKLTLKIPDPNKVKSIIMSDLTGQKIRDLEYATEIELSGIPAGIYLLRLTFENGELMKKIIIN